MKNVSDYAYNIVKQFIDEKLAGNIADLKTYCFAELKGCRPYGVCNGSFDCDNTRLACAIYVLLWGGKGKFFEDMTMENIGTGKDYRGDTINSFRSVLGDFVDGQCCAEIMGLHPPEDLKDRIGKFFKTYHTIGNFTILPNKKFSNNTLNTYRGKIYGDFFDIFLMECAKNDGSGNDIFSRLIKENDFMGDSFSRMSKEMFWDKYLSDNKPIQKFKHHFCKKNIKAQGNIYLDHVKNYIETSTEIIEFRAGKMIECLKTILY